MKLADWLRANDVNFAEFGRRIGRSTEAVRRYANDERIPDRDTMPAVVRETSGHVTANDFYPLDLPPTAAANSADAETIAAATSDAASTSDEPELPIGLLDEEPALPLERAA